jgi:hypothetical protein
MTRHLLVATALLLAGLAPTAAQRSYSPYAVPKGGDCSVLMPYYGPQMLWIGRFAGGRELDTSADRVFDDYRTANRCFFTERDCRLWLQSVTEQFSQPPGYAMCFPASGATPGVRGPAKP